MPSGAPSYGRAVPACRNGGGVWAYSAPFPCSPHCSCSPPAPRAPFRSLDTANWQQAPDRTEAFITTPAGLVLHGAPWSNGQADEQGLRDGNAVSSIQTFNHVGAHSYLSFKVHAAGRYLALTAEPQGLPFRFFSTDHAWQGSTVVPTDEWLFAHAWIEESGRWWLVLSRGNYEAQGGEVVSAHSGILSATGLDHLRQAPLTVAFIDNYAGSDAHLVLGPATVTDRRYALTPLEGAERFDYLLNGPPRVDRHLADARPIAAAACTRDDGSLDVDLELPPFTGPVDLYLGLYAPALDAGLVYVLGADGSFTPRVPEDVWTFFTAADTAPWRAGHRGRLLETLTGIGPATLGVGSLHDLPAGSHSFLLAVTPPGRTDSFALWNAYLQVPGPCHGRPVPDGSAGYLAGEVVVPGATLLHRGESAHERLAVSGNALVAVRKDGALYLYHPDLGQQPLSEATSAQAVGRFIARRAETARSARTAEGDTAPKRAPWGSTVTLDTGVVVAPKDEELLTLRNTLGRWAAVVDPDYGAFGETRGREKVSGTNAINLSVNCF